MTTSIQRRVVAVALTGTLLVAFGGCARTRCCPPMPFPHQVVMRGNVDRPGDCRPVTAATMPAAASLPADALEPYPGHEGASFWVKPGLDLRGYDHLRFPAVRVVPASGSEVASFPDALKQRAADALKLIMLETVAPYYDVVEAPGEHVLDVRLTITDLVAAQEVAEGDPAVGVGAAALEGELVDSRTGERLLAFVDRIEGSARGTEAEAEWRPVEGAFREWADALLDFLDHWEERLAEAE